MGHTPHKPERQRSSLFVQRVILHQVARDEPGELTYHQCRYIGMVEMSRQEWAERCQKAVGSRSAIHILDDVGFRQAVDTVKLGYNLLGHQSFVDIAHKARAERCARPFIAENEAQRRCVGHDAVAVPQPGVGTCTQYARNSFGVAQQRTCGTDQIGGDLASVVRDIIAQQLL